MREQRHTVAVRKIKCLLLLLGSSSSSSALWSGSDVCVFLPSSHPGVDWSVKFMLRQDDLNDWVSYRWWNNDTLSYRGPLRSSNPMPMHSFFFDKKHFLSLLKPSWCPPSPPPPPFVAYSTSLALFTPVLLSLFLPPLAQRAYSNTELQLGVSLTSHTLLTPGTLCSFTALLEWTVCFFS